MTELIQFRLVRPVLRGLLAAGAVTILVACYDGPTRPGGSLGEVIPTTYEGSGPDGLRHKLFITPPKRAVDDEKSIIEIESTVTNTGALTLPIITRSCTLLPADLTSAGGIIFKPENPPDCGDRTADTLSLGPGQSTTTLVGIFSIEGVSPGLYSVDVKHLEKPAFLTRFQFRLP
jgi:hypothetical protein